MNDDWQTAADWDRVADVVRRRRASLRITQSATEGVSHGTWWKLETAGQSSYREATLVAVEDALRWERGSLRTVAAGGQPTERPGPAETTADRLNRMQIQMDRLEAQVRELRRLLLPGGEPR